MAIGQAEVRIDGIGAVRLALGILAVLFSLRVALQLVQTVLGLDSPIPMVRWDSGTMPYGVLLALQAAILVGLVWCIRAVDGRRRPRVGQLLLIVGGLYGAAMVIRMGIGVSGLSAHRWFMAPVPTALHMVLAGFLVVLGGHWRGGLAGVGGLLRVGFYPLAVGGGIVLYLWARQGGVAAAPAAYLAVIIAGAAIAVGELLLPYRGAWRPRRGTVGDDGFYLAVVQIALPALLSAGVVAMAGWAGVTPRGLWPHQWPVAGQVVLMLVTADFMRYWLHRASHAWPPLWRLHAVHHSPEGLYALNVGRFHPVEKAVQFTLDTLPFVVLGVSDAVLGGYLVFYAINGFFQHCNIDVRLGWLNWLISGPELHRWHHSRDARVSGHNFGNNLIVWDVLFGTRMLPKGRHVGALGLNNRRYPVRPLAQTAAPFFVDPNGATVS